ncbi:bifunctional riboflavin kinase/FAD synthetase [uncultured Bacteroides sp.]|uniref:bifunctional riboflavin kinase/FAD synthetase n=1 Tax=uncultured Bacteroides sp. TaxID=162156 RepID=UPI00260C5F72|nr:bifunctional riboflavin kinase/FAD synthetase [uncultured Bacteroides sp.]
MKIGAICSNNLPSVATIGFFDGVHRGHRHLIDQVCAEARKRGWASAVITFPVHPRKVIQPEFCPKLLTTYEEKVELLGATAVDYCLTLDFTPYLAALSAHDFMEVLKNRYNIRALLIGYDHRFGHNRSEGFEDYVAYGRELGMDVIPAGPCLREGERAVSSSAVRRLLEAGEVEQAASLLGYEYFLSGKVVEGHQVGRKLGFPTANLQVGDADKLVPADGVYAVRVEVQGTCYGGMLSIGYRPTLNNGTDRSIEVHIFHFNADIYHCPMRIFFVRRLRAELKFDSLEELTERLRQDKVEAEKVLNEYNR